MGVILVQINMKKGITLIAVFIVSSLLFITDLNGKTENREEFIYKPVFNSTIAGRSNFAVLCRHVSGKAGAPHYCRLGRNAEPLGIP
jgi:hypothetical protein